MPDVIVVGAGPAGSAAAKRCAEYGLETAMVEKRKLPRDKVCSGMVMGPVAHSLIKQEFGAIPEAVLCQPSYLKGYKFHTPGIGSQNLDNFTSLTWRRNLDYWMSEKAQASGVKIWQNARLVGLTVKERGFLAEIEKDGKRQKIEARFVIGADGANSMVRRRLFPQLKVIHGQVFQQCYPGKIDLDMGYIHWFYPLEISPAYFSAHQKDNIVVVDVGGAPGTLKQLMVVAKDFLAKNYHFDFSQPPVWQGSCLGIVLFRPLFSRTFLPAKGNALLVGDAAGLPLPVSGEGIGTGIKSALMAADAVIKASKSGVSADSLYLNEVKVITDMFGEILPWFKKISAEAKSGGRYLPQILAQAYGATLREF